MALKIKMILAALCVIALGLYSYYNAERVSGQFQVLLSEGIEKQVLLQKLDHDASLASMHIYKIAVKDLSTETRTQSVSLVKTALQNLSVDLQEIQKTEWSESEKSAVADYEKAWNEFKQEAQALLLIADSWSDETYEKYSGELNKSYANKHKNFLLSTASLIELHKKSVDEARSSSFALIERIKIFSLAFAVLAGVLVSLFMLFSYRGIQKHIKAIASSLTVELLKLKQSSVELTETSNILSSASTDQAAALQQTVAAIDEVSAMIAKNADNSNSSKSESDKSSEAARRGKDAVHEMINSIEQIASSNTNIVTQIEAGNKEIAEITKVINEIGEKTKVINDIVFQTKLLSFNASVEAARAGEQGKGFAVVAQEVGNLAQMSGNAAQEISDMLNASVAKVDGIVKNTTERVRHLMVESKEKIANGTESAHRCGNVLDEIVSHVSQVDSMLNEIAIASREQSLGISEINKAMNKLDSVTQQNAVQTQKCYSLAKELNTQAEQMEKYLESLGSGQAAESPNAHEQHNFSFEKSLDEQNVSFKLSSDFKIEEKQAPVISLAAARKDVEKPKVEAKPVTAVFASKDKKTEVKTPEPVISSPAKVAPIKSDISGSGLAKSSPKTDIIGSGISIPREDDPRFEDV